MSLCVFTVSDGCLQCEVWWAVCLCVCLLSLMGVCSVKFVGLFVILLVGLWTAVDLNRLLSDITLPMVSGLCFSASLSQGVSLLDELCVHVGGYIYLRACRYVVSYVNFMVHKLFSFLHAKS